MNKFIVIIYGSTLGNVKYKSSKQDNKKKYN